MLGASSLRTTSLRTRLLRMLGLLASLVPMPVWAGPPPTRAREPDTIVTIHGFEPEPVDDPDDPDDPDRVEGPARPDDEPEGGPLRTELPPPNLPSDLAKSESIRVAVGLSPEALGDKERFQPQRLSPDENP